MEKYEIGTAVKTANSFGKIVGKYGENWVIVIPNYTYAKGYYFVDISESELEVPDWVWTDYPDWEE